MNKTLIIGASGQIGKLLLQKMLDDEQELVALVRDKKKLAGFSSSHLEVFEADLNEDFSNAFDNCDKAIFVAGSGGNTGHDKTLMIDLYAACRAVDFAKQHNVKHFILVSSIGVAKPLQGPENMQPYLIAKHMADEHLQHSGLHYSIIRPGALTDADATGRFTTQMPDDKDEAKITRADVATALLYRLNNPLSRNSVLELFNGDQSVEEALNPA